MRIAEIITNPATGRFSNTKLASATSYLLFSLAFIAVNVVGLVKLWEDKPADWLEGLWWAYAGVAFVAAGHQTVGKAVAGRGQQQQAPYYGGPMTGPGE